MFVYNKQKIKSMRSHNPIYPLSKAFSVHIGGDCAVTMFPGTSSILQGEVELNRQYKFLFNHT